MIKRFARWALVNGAILAVGLGELSDMRWQQIQEALKTETPKREEI